MGLGFLGHGLVECPTSGFSESALTSRALWGLRGIEADGGTVVW